MSRVLIVSITCLVAGCGASSAGNDREQTDRELAPMHGTLGAFHDVLAPVYHMDKGSERDARACGSESELQSRAANVVSDLRSAKDPAFKAAAETLSHKVEELGSACSEHAGVEAKLEGVHDAFHATLEAAHEGEVTHDDKPEPAHTHESSY